MEKIIKNKQAFVLWFTGLSGSGKTTIALELKKKLVDKGKKVDILDGDSIRDSINLHLGFSRNDIRENNLTIAKIAKERLLNYDFILVPIISPYKNDRTEAKRIIGAENFFEVFINTPIDECINRDPKGLYKKALNGKIKNFIGICNDTPYEEPAQPDILVQTENLSINESVNKILGRLQKIRY